MADNELLIKISADAKNAQKAFDDVKAKSAELENSLGKLAQISAVAFVAFTAEIGLSIKAFGEAEKASKSLALVLQNQGIYTDALADSYKEYASQIAAVTGLDDDAIVNAQAITQTYIGQEKITKELTAAIADYAEKTGDLTTAAAAVGKAIQDGTGALVKEGIELTNVATRAERTEKVIEFLNGRFKGQAEAANQGVGSIRGLTNAFGDLQEQIGAQFAPTFAIAVGYITDFFKTVKNDQSLTRLIAGFVAFGATAALLTGALATVVLGLITANAAAAAFGLTLSAALGPIGLIALGIAGLAGAVGIYIANQNKANKTAAEAADVTKTLSIELEKLEAIQKRAVATGNNDLLTNVNERINIVSKQLAKAKSAQEELDEIERKKGTQNREAVPRDTAAENEIRRQEKVRRDIITENNNLIQLELDDASAEQVALKKQEIDQLTALQNEHDLNKRELLKEQIQKTQDLQEEAFLTQLAKDEEYDTIEIEEKTAQGEALTALNEKQIAQNKDLLLTEEQARQKVRDDRTKAEIAGRNKEMDDRLKHGNAVAQLNKFLASEEIQATKSVAGELVQLGQSKNAELKAIGKAAAISQVIIGTAESASNIAQQIPKVIPYPFAIPVIAALVAARVAFGYEQISTIRGAAQGGLVEGGIPGQDSVPYFLQQNELIAPAKNFEEVVAGTQLIREFKKGGEDLETPGGGGGTAQVVIGFDGRQASQVLTARQLEDKSLGISIAGSS